MNLKAKTFEFTSYSINSDKTEAKFFYAIQFDGHKKLDFIEKIQLPSIQQRSDISEDVLDRILHGLHLILGVTYWKLYCPAEIKITTEPLSSEMAHFWQTVYLKGLGEFYYQNNLPLSTAPSFPFEEISYYAMPVQASNRSLIGVGGGKDSLVAYELLKQINHEMTGLVINTQREHALIDNVIQVMNIGALKVKRIIDPLLFDQNKLQGTFNGHVPISAVYAFIGFLTAYLYDYKYVIVGNEQSANSENVVFDGVPINHQWSKSAEFEKAFQDYTRLYITPDVTYFSLLRPWYELKITEEFIKSPQYLHVFSGCNRNFKANEPGNVGKLWCGECAKCAFIFTLLSAFLPKETVVSIFGKNLYADDNLIETYCELLGIKGTKPFDCVGTEDEVKVAMNRAYKRGEFSADLVIKMFVSEVLSKGEDLNQMEKQVMVVHDTSLIPQKFKQLFTA